MGLFVQQMKCQTSHPKPLDKLHAWTKTGHVSFIYDPNNTFNLIIVLSGKVTYGVFNMLSHIIL